MSWNLLPNFLSRKNPSNEIDDETFMKASVEHRQTAKLPEQMYLEPCPFCAGLAMEVTTIPTNGERSFYTTHIECVNCHAESGKVCFDIKSDPFRELADKWNLRSNKDTIIKTDQLISENKILRRIIAYSAADCIYCKRQYHEMDDCSNCYRAKDLL